MKTKVVTVWHWSNVRIAALIWCLTVLPVTYFVPAWASLWLGLLFGWYANRVFDLWHLETHVHFDD